MRNLIIIAGLCAAFTSCDKLDQQPEATISRDAIFGSERGIELYTNSFYDNLPDGNSIFRIDEMADYSARNTVPDFIRPGVFTPRQSSGWSWTALRNVNYFLENISTSPLPQDVKDHYTGLARFFRAWFYYDKVKRFGEVPWIGKTMNVDDPSLFNKRDSRQLVMDSVLADINFACDKLRATQENSRSSINKMVANAVKSRICLFEGTFRKYHDYSGGLAEGLGSTSQTWLQEAATAAETVMAQGGYSLNTAGGADKAYRQLFISNAPVANEIILSAVADATLNVLNDANWWWTSATYGARVSLTRTFVNTYLKLDGTPFTETPGYQTMPFAEEVKNRDLRLKQTIRSGDYKRINGGVTEAAPPVFSYTYTGYQPIKWTLDDTYFDGGTRNTNSISIIRYAEVLLNYAEAKAELGTLTDDDWNKTIGALRRRAGITGNTAMKPVIVDTYLQSNYFPGIADAALLEIRRERGIELVFEGLRFNDLVRWKKGELLEMSWNGFYVSNLNQAIDLNEDGKADVLFYKGTAPAPIAGVTFINVSDIINGTANPQRLSGDTQGEINWLNNIPRKWENKNYLYPIPENDLLMNPALGQNPGW
ncbi:RagB/SusD family nutrient uptake outer membrane protein [Flavihumibacter solisilvae]|uniref:Starch-binding protein n=1 Tax=Flavihumibacter solisilvae TaxID=1349421 RepID=A0A0C1L627_9BACT|nr:RagB/SusD family nutrient uptake outer membrane protein [Flavihumibacter solisilvae]KIC94976.1 starch-binding protein [Flavihumibacter solisilvae]